jgi:hypothetical protein
MSVPPLRHRIFTDYGKPALINVSLRTVSPHGGSKRERLHAGIDGIKSGPLVR